MQRMRGEFGNALVVALVSIGLILGVLSISLVEFVPPQPVPGTATLIPPPIILTTTDTPIPATPLAKSSETSTPSATPTSTRFSTLIVSQTAQNTSSACTPGASGWIKNYIVKPGDNLFRIAVNYYTTLELMRKVNCRTGNTIYSGEVLWVPNVPTPRTSYTTTSPGSTLTIHPTDPITETALPFTATYIPTSTIQTVLP